jgi:glutamine synthetase
MMAMSMLDHLQPVEGMGPVGEVRIMPDPATFVALPYAPGAGAMVADLVQPDGEPWGACARAYLRGAVADLAEHGYAAAAAFEPEFTLGRREASPDGGPDRLVPNDDSLCYSATGFHQAHDYAVELQRALQAQGMQVENYYPSSATGSRRCRSGMPARCAPPTTTCSTGRPCAGSRSAAACGRAWRPSRSPTRRATAATCTCRCGRPARTGQPGEPVFYDDADRYRLSETGYHFVGGLLAHLPALTALTCGSVNSYRRLAPQMWSSAYTVYGMDNREAAVRICSPMRDDPAGSVNLELKPSDSSANPYLALGACLYAGLDGIRRKLDPGEAVNVDPATLTDAERLAAGARRLPASLAEALDALQADDLLMESLGDLRRRAYLAVKRSEVAAFAGADPAYECFEHFTKI